MNIHAVLIRGILIVAMSMAVCVAMLHRAYSQQQSPTVASTAPAHNSSTQPPMVVLPTISVRPTAADIAAALESQDDEAAAAFIEAAQVQPIDSRALLPGLHLDMPYYSFGKTLPRVSKE